MGSAGCLELNLLIESHRSNLFKRCVCFPVPSFRLSGLYLFPSGHAWPEHMCALYEKLLIANE